MRMYAPAKINWTLEVVGKRSDGYHELRTILQTVELADMLEISEGDAIRLEVEGPHEMSEDDLILRAARRLREESGHSGGATIRLEKRIPVSAGLGGGSSDAAATLRGLNVLWGLNWKKERLADVAASVSSDAPFFMYGGTALVWGRGELIEPLEDSPPVDLVLLVPPVDMAGKTARMFGSLTASDFSDGSLTEQLLGRLGAGSAPRNGEMFNAFESVAYRTWPELAAYRRTLLDAGAARVHLAGSGPTLFAITPGSVGELRMTGDGLLSPRLLAMTRTIGRSESLRTDG